MVSRSRVSSVPASARWLRSRWRWSTSSARTGVPPSTKARRKPSGPGQVEGPAQRPGGGVVVAQLLGGGRVDRTPGWPGTAGPPAASGAGQQRGHGGHGGRRLPPGQQQPGQAHRLDRLPPVSVLVEGGHGRGGVPGRGQRPRPGRPRPASQQPGRPVAGGPDGVRAGQRPTVVAGAGGPRNAPGTAAASATMRSRPAAGWPAPGRPRRCRLVPVVGGGGDGRLGAGHRGRPVATPGPPEGQPAQLDGAAEFPRRASSTARWAVASSSRNSRPARPASTACSRWPAASSSWPSTAPPPQEGRGQRPPVVGPGEPLPGRVPARVQQRARGRQGAGGVAGQAGSPQPGQGQSRPGAQGRPRRQLRARCRPPPARPRPAG